MYTKYFGFNEKPFTLTPNPRFIFLSQNHKEAFAHLLYGINNHYGFIELTGEVGTGKTTVLRTLMEQLHEDSYRTALIFNPCLTGVELLRSINQEFGIAANSEYVNELLAELNRFLLSENADGRTVVLVIDEAQNLQPDVLEQIRLISNLETENDKLIQIILAGQPELDVLLERPDLRQLNQRIAVRYRLRSMCMNETQTYIRHRMEVAGETGGVSFSRNAIKWIYLYTRGIPRMINILCDRSLLVAYGDERRRINFGIVARAIREILNQPQSRLLARVVKYLAAVSMLVLLLLGTVSWFKMRSHEPQHNATASAAKVGTANGAPLPVTAISPTKSEASVRPTLEKDIISHGQNDTHIQAFNAIMRTWEKKPIRIFNIQLTIPGMFARLAAKRNLRVTMFHGTLDRVLSFDLPFLVVTKVRGTMGKYCYAVTSTKGDNVSISPPLLGSSIISKNDLAALADGTFYLVWQNTWKIPDKISSGDKLYEIKKLQGQLKQAGFYHEAIDGAYNSATIKAVTDFQQTVGITVNDSVGALTLAALSKYDASLTTPTLLRN